ncbi:MAG: phosphomannomutase/phosphoglucomutase [Actinomycetales bacterium]|nr:phosphomannomutase/phosphoglucomutase [Actinomycetales bacterium]
MLNLREIVKANDIRGLVGSQLDDRVVRALGTAFARRELASGAERLVIGHDMRDSSPRLSEAFALGARSEGLPVVHMGLCSTDALYYASGALAAPGAMFTASHNPAAWNGMKLCRSGARPVGLDSGLAEVRDLAQALLDDPAWPVDGDGAPPAAEERRDLLPGYAGHLRSLVDLSGIRPLRVVVDAGNGMAGMTTPAVLGSAAGLALPPVEVIPLYFELDGTFPNHEANPLDPKNLLDLQAAVPQYGADLGLAFDGDADRCFVVDERGEAVNPSAVSALVATREIAKELAAGRQPTVIHNLITSRAVPEVIREAGGTAVRTRVGHAFIKAEMAAADAVFGAEHSAHYYFRDFWYADTGMLAALHVLAALGEQSEPLSVLLSVHQRYAASGEINFRVPDVAQALELVAAAFAADPGVVQERLDGLTVADGPVDGDGAWWFNVRPSNTEPMLRLNVEAGDRPTMEALRDRVRGVLAGIAG